MHKPIRKIRLMQGNAFIPVRFWDYIIIDINSQKEIDLRKQGWVTCSDQSNIGENDA